MFLPPQHSLLAVPFAIWALPEIQHLLTFAGVRFGAFRSVGYGYDQFGNRVAVRSGGQKRIPILPPLS